MKCSIIFRQLLFIPLICATFHQCHVPLTDEKRTHYIQTVNGPISVDSLGTTLIHEHVFLDWRTADETMPADWNNDDAFHYILPYLEEMKLYGVHSFLECTPKYIGRNPLLLKRLSNATGLNILTNTGFYGVRNNYFIASHIQNKTAVEIADIWINEFENGIDNSGIKPGFIKISVEADSTISDFHSQLVKAAAITHKNTGLTIVSHTGIDTTAFLQISLLEAEGVAPEAFVWTHAQNGTTEGHIKMAKKGAWISLDGLGWVQPSGMDSSALMKYVNFISNLKEEDLLHKTLISHDAGWYEHGEDFDYKGYTNIFTLLFPVLKKRGFTKTDFDMLLIGNPKNAYATKKRSL